MQKIFAAAVILLVGVAVLAADEFGGIITKVEGNKLSVTKFKKGEKGGEEVTLTVSDSVKVVKGKFNQETKKFEAGEALEGGLKNERFTKGKVFGFIVTNADNVVTEIRVGEGRKKKDDNK
jgi:hypothetical protein